MGQTSWEYTLQETNRLAHITDAVEMNGTVIIGAGSFDINFQTPDRSQIVWLDETGSQLAIEPLYDLTTTVSITKLLPLPDLDRVHAFGRYSDNLSSDGNGFFQYELHPNGLVGGDWLHLFPGMERAQLEDAVIYNGDHIFLAGVGRVNTQWFNRFMRMRLGIDGAIQDSVIEVLGNGLSLARSAVRWRGMDWVSLEGGPSYVPGVVKCIAFDSDLSFQEGFPLRNLSGSGSIAPSDSLLVTSLDLIPLDEDKMFIAGSYGYIEPGGKRAGAMIVDTAGNILNTFLPRSEYLHDFGMLIQGASELVDGNLYFAMVENFSTGPPDLYSPQEPSRLHVYKLDSDLNVLCEHVIDGFVDGMYYLPERIKATSDGGFLLMGSRKNLNSSQPFHGWIRKFGPSDCTVSVNEWERTPISIAFPNPGVDGFTVTMNGPVINNGSLLLYNGQGQCISTTRVDNSRVEVSAIELASGIYHYKIVDRTGRPVSSGRWIKE